MRLHRLRCHRPQVELQAARQHGRGHFLRVGRREHEFEVVGRLFERFQHRVERGRRQHVHFVDHVDLEAADDRLVDGLVEQQRDLFDAAVRRRIELDIVDEAAGIDVATCVADAARLRSDPALPVGADAVQRLGEQPRHRRLADAARAGEQVRVVQAALRQCIGQRLHDMLLPDQLLEAARTVLAREDQIAH